MYTATNGREGDSLQDQNQRGFPRRYNTKGIPRKVVHKEDVDRRVYGGFLGKYNIEDDLNRRGIPGKRTERGFLDRRV